MQTSQDKPSTDDKSETPAKRSMKKNSVSAVSLDLGGKASITHKMLLEKQLLPGQTAPWAEDNVFIASLSGGDIGVLSPPMSLFQADDVIDSCPSLAKNIACMVTNTVGHGFSLRPRVEIKEGMSDILWSAMQKEKDRVQSFLENLCIDYSFTDLMELLQTHLERYANAYWEILRSPDGRVVGVSPIENPKKMRLCKKDEKASSYTHRSRVGTKYENIRTERRFRRFVKLGDSGSKRYYRQYGDSRQLNCETGEYGNFQTVPSNKRANEILHFRLPHSNSEYGVVRWISALIDAVMIKTAKMCNFDVLDNGGTPPMAIAIAGSSDPKLEERIRDQIAEIKAKGGRSSVLIIQVDAEEVGVQASETTIQPRITFENLAQMMIEEGMFLEQLKFSDREICAVFRIPPLLLGNLEDVPNKATANIAKETAEEQVFAPARRKIEEVINRLLMDAIMPDRLERGVMYWDFVFNSLSTDRTEALLSVAKEGREGKSITPNEHHKILDQALPDLRLDPLPDDPRNDVPMLYLESGIDPDLMELQGENIENVKSLLSRSTGKKVTKCFVYRPSHDDSDPYTPEAA